MRNLSPRIERFKCTGNGGRIVWVRITTPIRVEDYLDGTTSEPIAMLGHCTTEDRGESCNRNSDTEFEIVNTGEKLTVM